jgi:hypothetical protein
MAFQLPEKDKLYIQLRRDGRGFNVSNELKDAVYEALSYKSVVRARTLFNIGEEKYRVLDYEKHGSSANMSILKLSK